MPRRILVAGEQPGSRTGDSDLIPERLTRQLRKRYLGDPVRVELLEARSVPAWEPLRIVVTSITLDHVLSAGEGLVEDEFLEGQDRRHPLLLTVYVRITIDPRDHEKRWTVRA
jgi:hypothetical protein